VTALSIGSTLPGVKVIADSDTDILSVAGAIGVAAGAAGIGAGVNVHTLTKMTEASIASGSVVNAEGNVIVEAISDEVMQTFTLAAAGGSTAGVGIAADAYVLNMTTQAFIGHNPVDGAFDSSTTSVRTDGSVLVQAIDETEADLIVGGIAIGGTAGIGAAVGVAVVNKTTEAFIGQEASVTGEGHSTVEARTGRFGVASGSTKTGVAQGDLELNEDRSNLDVEVGTPDAALDDDDYDDDGTSDIQDDSGLAAERVATAVTDADFRGVAVSASSKDDVETMAFSVAVGGSVGIAIGAAVNVVDITTTGAIGAGAEINQNITGSADSTQSVLVAAASDFGHVGVGAGAAVGGAGAGAPGVDVSIIDVTTNALIGDSAVVDARDDVAVIAVAEEKFLIVAAGVAAGGTFALGGGVGVVVVTDTTLAAIGANANIEAGGDVVVLAEDDTDLFILAGGVGIGIGAAGIGASVSVGVFDKTTDAFIGDGAIVNAKGNGNGYDDILTGDVEGDGSFSRGTAHGVIVQADSTERFLNISFAGAGGLYAGIAGAIGVTLIDSDTTSVIGANARINQNWCSRWNCRHWRCG